MGKKIRRASFASVTIFIMVLIFIFSAQTGADSEIVSGGMQSGLEAALTKIFGAGETQLIIYGALEFLIRKSAHMVIFFLLGFSFYQTLASFDVKKRLLLITVLFCVFYAATDEFHQLFVDGRSAELRDVALDAIGGAAGAYAGRLYGRITAGKIRN